MKWTKKDIRECCAAIDAYMLHNQPCVGMIDITNELGKFAEAFEAYFADETRRQAKIEEYMIGRREFWTGHWATDATKKAAYYDKLVGKIRDQPLPQEVLSYSPFKR